MLDWPLADLLAACRQKMKAAALENHRHAEVLWALIAPHSKKKLDPPEVPAILKD